MTKQDKSRGEMPFLDHLEELRWHILWSLLALVVGSAIGFWVVQHYNVLGLLKRPIAPLLPAGRLYITRPTDAFVITLKLAVAVGAVLASPIVIWQTWAFLSPALYEQEKHFVIPILMAGLLLFLGGALMAYEWILPTALHMLFSFQRPDLEFIITADEYFSFASLFILAFGLIFELPLVIVLLAAFGIVDPRFFAKHRPIALVLGAGASALLTPPDAFSMLMMLIPLMLLYEIGILVGRLMWRARIRRRESETLATVFILFLLTGTVRAEAQQPAQSPAVPVRSDTLAPDSLRRAGQGQTVDTSAARKLGLPTAPDRSFPPQDSVIESMVARKGFHATRYAGDTLTLFGDTREIVMNGHSLVEREGSTLEADSVRFFQAECRLQATGSPQLFDKGTVLVGEGMRYNTCERRGIVAHALTSFNQSGVQWYLRGQLAVDSASTRIYAGGSSITSSDLPMPDYHFAAGKIKWVSNTILVARPAVLYVRDVPVLWLPFIFQDMRQGRRSGLLVPNFGINDLVRPNRGYQRHVSNIGYFIALNDYMDVRASLDWYDKRYLQLNGELRYKWLDRFVQGNLSVSRMYQFGEDGSPGSRSLHLVLNHSQQFNMRTRLSANINYATSAQVLQRNSVDPALATASLVSAANFNKQFDWGTLSLGGNRSQDLSSGVVNQTLPALTLSPQPINIGSIVTWSPSFSLSSVQALHQPGGVLSVPPAGAVPQVDSLRYDTRNTSIQIATPIRIGSWNWSNSISVIDNRSNQRTRAFLPDPTSPGDSLERIYGQTFSTGVDWSTGIGLPVLFPSTWRLAPSIGIQNSTSGPFLLRNQYTGGGFVSQGKRLSFGAAISPTLFGFFPGFGPLQRIRHSISPSVAWHYAPAASVPADYARAVDPSGTRPVLQSPVQHSISFGLSQIFEAKLKPPPGDTAAAQNPRKIKLLSIQTSGVSYDFEQAKDSGRTGWQTQTLTNTFTSDLLPGFTLTTTHDLWAGAAGSDTAKFSPFLSSVSTRFSLTGATLGRLLSLFTGGGEPATPTTAPPPASSQEPSQPGQGPFPGTVGPQTGLRPTDDIASRGGGGRGLMMSFSYDDQRRRPSPETASVNSGVLGQGNNRTLGVTMSFSPSRNWQVSWNTQYNFTTGQFGQHMLRLERDLRRWRATFDFLKSPNGNFAFNFNIVLLDESDIKFRYDQQTLKTQ
jgi:Tat protein translocase TatC